MKTVYKILFFILICLCFHDRYLYAATSDEIQLAPVSQIETTFQQSNFDSQNSSQLFHPGINYTSLRCVMRPNFDTQGRLLKLDFLTSSLEVMYTQHFELKEPIIESSAYGGLFNESLPLSKIGQAYYKNGSRELCPHESILQTLEQGACLNNDFQSYTALKTSPYQAIIFFRRQTKGVEQHNAFSLFAPDEILKINLTLENRIQSGQSTFELICEMMPHYDSKGRLLSIDFVCPFGVMYTRHFELEEPIIERSPCGGLFNETLPLSKVSQAYYRNGARDPDPYNSILEDLENGKSVFNEFYSYMVEKYEPYSRFVCIYFRKKKNLTIYGLDKAHQKYEELKYFIQQGGQHFSLICEMKPYFDREGRLLKIDFLTSFLGVIYTHRFVLEEPIIENSPCGGVFNLQLPLYEIAQAYYRNGTRESHPDKSILYALENGACRYKDFISYEAQKLEPFSQLIKIDFQKEPLTAQPQHPETSLSQQTIKSSMNNILEVELYGKYKNTKHYFTFEQFMNIVTQGIRFLQSNPELVLECADLAAWFLQKAPYPLVSSTAHGYLVLRNLGKRIESPFHSGAKLPLSLMKGKAGEGNNYLLQNPEAQKLFPKRILKKIQAKIPADYGELRLNQDGKGLRWLTKDGENNIRIDRGDPYAEFPSIRVDHVRVNKDGEVIGRSGQMIDKKVIEKPTKEPDAHIPLSEWLKWKTMNQP